MSFIYPLLTITVGVSYLLFSYFDAVFHCWICTGINFFFFTDSFSTSMMDAIPCFPGTNLACLITTLFCILDIRSTLFFLSLNSLHTSCILIGLKHPYEKCAYPYPEITVEKSSCGPEISINVPCPFSQYTGWTNIFYALFLLTYLQWPRLCYHETYPLWWSTMFSSYPWETCLGGVTSKMYPYCYLGEKLWCQINPCPCQYRSILGINAVLWYWG